MKNINPLAGLRQLITGTLYLPRKLMLELLRKKKITPLMLGYFLIAVFSADWNDGEHRYGVIRHDLRRLASYCGISYSTFASNFNLLFKLGLLGKKLSLYYVPNFDYFQRRDSKYSNKHIQSDQDVREMFGELLFQRGGSVTASDNPESFSRNQESNSDNPECLQIEESRFLKIPFRVQVNTEVGNQNSSPNTRTMAEYQRIYKEDGYTNLTPEDMQWLDMYVDEEGNTIT